MLACPALASLGRSTSASYHVMRHLRHGNSLLPSLIAILIVSGLNAQALPHSKVFPLPQDAYRGPWGFVPDPSVFREWFLVHHRGTAVASSRFSAFRVKGTTVYAAFSDNSFEVCMTIKANDCLFSLVQVITGPTPKDRTAGFGTIDGSYSFVLQPGTPTYASWSSSKVPQGRRWQRLEKITSSSQLMFCDYTGDIPCEPSPLKTEESWLFKPNLRTRVSDKLFWNPFD